MKRSLFTPGDLDAPLDTNQYWRGGRDLVICQLAKFRPLLSQNHVKLSIKAAALGSVLLLAGRLKEALSLVISPSPISTFCLVHFSPSAPNLHNSISV